MVLLFSLGGGTFLGLCCLLTDHCSVVQFRWWYIPRFELSTDHGSVVQCRCWYIPRFVFTY